VQGVLNWPNDDIKTYIQTTAACVKTYDELAGLAAAVAGAALSPEVLKRLSSLPKPVVEVPEKLSKGIDLGELFKAGVEDF